MISKYFRYITLLKPIKMKLFGESGVLISPRRVHRIREIPCSDLPVAEEITVANRGELRLDWRGRNGKTNRPIGPLVDDGRKCPSQYET
jgi:hypothetical protein